MDHLLSAESVSAEEGSFWGALNHAAMVHRLQTPSYGFFALSLSFLLPLFLCLFYCLPNPLSFIITLSYSDLLAFAVTAFLSFHYLFACEREPERQGFRGLWTEKGKGGFWEGRGFCLFGQMHTAISGLLSVIKGADDVEQIHGPCLISPCSGPHPLS